MLEMDSAAVRRGERHPRPDTPEPDELPGRDEAFRQLQAEKEDFRNVRPAESIAGGTRAAVLVMLFPPKRRVSPGRVLPLQIGSCHYYTSSAVEKKAKIPLFPLFSDGPAR